MQVFVAHNQQKTKPLIDGQSASRYQKIAQLVLHQKSITDALRLPTFRNKFPLTSKPKTADGETSLNVTSLFHADAFQNLSSFTTRFRGVAGATAGRFLSSSQGCEAAPRLRIKFFT